MQEIRRIGPPASPPTACIVGPGHRLFIYLPESAGSFCIFRLSNIRTSSDVRIYLDIVL